MRGSRNFRQGGGGLRVFGVFIFIFFFAFFLVLSLFYRSQIVNFKEKISFFKFFQWGGGGNFFQGGGSNCLFPIETHITCDFPGGVRTPCPPFRSALGCDRFSFPDRKMMRSPLAPVLEHFPATLLYVFSRAPQKKSFLELTA